MRPYQLSASSPIEPFSGEFLLPFSRALGETAWPIPSGLLPGQDWLDTTTLQDNCLGRIIFNHEDEGLRPLLRIDGVLPELLKTEEEIAGIYVVKTVTDKKDRTSQTVSAQADIQRTFKTHSLEIARLCEDQRIVIFKVPMKLDDLRSRQARASDRNLWCRWSGNRGRRSDYESLTSLRRSSMDAT